MTHLSPKQLADRWACSREHVLRLIRSGKLPAFAANPGSKRPRWRIAIGDVLAFEQGNSARPPEKPVRRRRQQPEVIQFFK